MEDKHLYRETQWDVSAEEGRAHHGLVAIGFAILVVMAFFSLFFGVLSGEQVITYASSGGSTIGSSRIPASIAMPQIFLSME